ncbi:unnamed protein product [Spirodela intermedia]|uniref:Uncharacterized protein n=2 Tax=Spirodela intermedia TaxID=51605 RepID=A0A7I8ITQ5_SPIIN|nr:unnamed protein product [Spirodela intermedia]CAA6661185.1 unnamed protein product [Spirodela intermedia]CAA7397547.1 unnamed protein product [Spirodela intermedia]
MKHCAGILIALLCILLASPAASVSTVLAENRLRREGGEFWPVDCVVHWDEPDLLGK